MLANGNDEEGPSKQTAKPSVPRLSATHVLASALDAESLTNHAAGSFQVPDYKGVDLSRTDHHHVMASGSASSDAVGFVAAV
jgi:hypothetical protein